MGKIYDALEKADRDYSKSQFVRPRFGQVNKERADEEKIVPLVNATKNMNGSKLSATLIAYHSPQSIEAELFKVLRTNILFPAQGKVPKTILVTSPMPGDGKSLISANLAIAIAQGVEEYVLLMDCDIRKPTIHTLFGYNTLNGLSDYLLQSKDLAQFLTPTVIPKLSILPGGKPPANPSELLTSKKMKALLEEVRDRYEDRIIVIDSPPPSMAPETNALAQLVDGVVVVVKIGKTPRSAVTELVGALGKEKMLGVVPNYCDQSVKKYYGYDKSYHHTDGLTRP